MSQVAPRIPRNTIRERRARRRSQIVGLLTLMAAAAAPWLLWHRAIAAVAENPRLEFSYLAGWSGYILMASGLLFFVPVVASIGRLPGNRLYPRGRNAYLAWGVCLYLLGLIMAVQVAAVLRVHPLT
jgi:hypothetical protein